MQQRRVRRLGYGLLLLLFVGLWPTAGQAQQAEAQPFKGKVVVLNIQQPIDPSSARYLSRGLAAAEAQGAQAVIIHLNTYGGLLESADSMRTALLRASLPTAVYIDKNAASAGALISLACDKIYMAPGANIGAATVVMGGSGEAAPDKYQSYMRGLMRATAESKGRNPRLAEKMVDQDLVLPEAYAHLAEDGQVLTLTTSQALAVGFCEGQHESLAEAIAAFGYEAAEQATYTPSFVERAIGFLVRPGVSSVLLMLMMWGIFFALKAPGLGLPELVAVVAAALFFAPHYLEGLAENWELLTFVVGLALLVLEVFVIPGFAVAGILGIIGTMGGLVMMMVRNEGFDFALVQWNTVLNSALMVTFAIIASLVGVFWLGHFMVRRNKVHPIVDQSQLSAREGYVAINAAHQSYLGKTGVATTDLRPYGFIEVDGERLDAQTKGNFMAKGTAVEVLEISGSYLVVKAIPGLKEPTTEA